MFPGNCLETFAWTQEDAGLPTGGRCPDSANRGERAGVFVVKRSGFHGGGHGQRNTAGRGTTSFSPLQNGSF